MGLASGSQQEGRGQQDADERNGHENTLPLGGRAVVHVRLYGERGGGGVRERRAPIKIRRETNRVDKIRWV